MVDYKKGKIYKIVVNVDNVNKCYVGSTCHDLLCQRFARHTSNYRSWLMGDKKYMSSYELFEDYGYSNCKIELIELYPCNTKDELHQREGHYIKLLNSVNKVITGRKKKEYLRDNKDKIKQQRSKIYKCDCGATIQINNKSTHIKTDKHIKWYKTTSEYRKERLNKHRLKMEELNNKIKLI